MVYNRQAIYGRGCLKNMKDFLQKRLKGASSEENAISTKVRKSKKNKITKKKMIIGAVVLCISSPDNECDKCA